MEMPLILLGSYVQPTTEILMPFFMEDSMPFNVPLEFGCRMQTENSTEWLEYFVQQFSILMDSWLSRFDKIDSSVHSRKGMKIAFGSSHQSSLKVYAEFFTFSRGWATLWSQEFLPRDTHFLLCFFRLLQKNTRSKMTQIQVHLNNSVCRLFVETGVS